MRINDAIVLLGVGLLPSQTEIFRRFGARSHLVEQIAVRIELAQGYTKDLQQLKVESDLLQELDIACQIVYETCPQLITERRFNHVCRQASAQIE
ncbi:MAG: hypothetical protein ACRC62_29345 [Microcoleus sp.]